MKVKFKKEFLMEELDLPWSSISDIITGTSRWSQHHEIIFEYDEKFYKTTYSRGLTERQDEYPWDNKEEVECTEVHQVEKVVKVWEAI